MKEMMKREREKESATSARARDDADLSGAILNPFCAIKISPLTTKRASISLSLSLLFERFQSSRERDERETSALFRRGRFRRERLSL